MQHEFNSSHLSSENHIFPFKLIIDDRTRLVTLYKKKLIGYNSISLPTRQIVSVAINKNNELLFLSEIVITTANNQVRVNGFKGSDAKAIKTIIESLF